MKKTVHFSFRTTDENMDYLKQVANEGDRTPSYVLNKMIDYFRAKGSPSDTVKKIK
jgi:predicted transcriptional regulator